MKADIHLLHHARARQEPKAQGARPPPLPTAQRKQGKQGKQSKQLLPGVGSKSVERPPHVAKAAAARPKALTKAAPSLAAAHVHTAHTAAHAGDAHSFVKSFVNAFLSGQLW
jgi:hypothetical protein